MPDFIHKTTLALYLSAEPTELPWPVADYLVDPDMSAVGTGAGNGFHATVPLQYWKLDEPGNAVLEMTLPEKIAVNAAADAAALEVDKEVTRNEYTDRRMWRAFGGIMLDEVNLIRRQLGMTERTVEQFRTAVLNRINSV